jgi:3-hydroxyisobutyrate dehydrogenase
MTRVGFAGLGRMGRLMATNLADAGFALTVWNRSEAKAEELADRTGAAIAATPRELAESSEVVVTMLADDVASSRVHVGDDGLFSAAEGASHLLEMGTLSPRHVGELRAVAGDRVVVIDAPVSGSIDAARDRRLMVMVGADEATAAPVVPVLEAMGSELVFLGAPGAGAVMKLAVNLLIHGLNQTLAEALSLAEGAGIDLGTAYSVMERSAAAAPMLHYRKPQYLAEDESPVSFALSLARKDVGLALEVAEGLGLELPQTRVNHDQLTAAEDAGFGGRDMAAMLAYRRRGGS